ncbi:MAG: RDD family protein [Planctomycetota bacterium]
MFRIPWIAGIILALVVPAAYAVPGARLYLDLTPLPAAEGLLLAGREVTLQPAGEGTPGGCISFFAFRDRLEPQCTFRGGFTAALLAPRGVLVAEPAGVAVYSPPPEPTYRSFIPAPAGMTVADLCLREGQVLVLMHALQPSRLLVMVLADAALTAFPAAPLPVPEGIVDCRLADSARGPVAAWRQAGRPEVQAAAWDGRSWQRHDFTRAAVNCFDLADGPVLYYIGTQQAERSGAIMRAPLGEDGWMAGTAIPGSAAGYAVKFQGIRVADSSMGAVVVRSNFLPALARTAPSLFSRPGCDVFLETDGVWTTAASAGWPVLQALVLAAAAAVAAAGAALVLRRWAPFVLYRPVHTIRVGTLLARAGGYAVDSLIVGAAALALLGLLRFQDIGPAAFVELLWLLFVSCLVVYGVLTELLAGATAGKFLLGLTLRNRIGMRCSLKEILVRNVVKVVEVNLPVIPAVTMLVSGENLRLGDLIAGTRVQQRERHGNH